MPWLFRYLPAGLLAAGALVLYARAGYGPLGNARQRAAPCTPTHCAHNASLLFVLAALALVVAARRARARPPAEDTSGPAVRKGFLDRVRQFNKRYLNPAALQLARHRRMYYAVLHHVGRRSGRTYATPIVVRRTPDGFVIPLPYGADTDWCRNLLAARHGTIEWHGVEVPVGQPVVIDAATARSLLPRCDARVWDVFGIKQYLRLKRTLGVPAAAGGPLD